MSNETEATSGKIKLHKDGRLTLNSDGTEVLIGHYNRTTGHLEFETRDYSVKLYQAVTARIGTRNEGKEPSGLKITSLSVKGEKLDEMPKNAPKRPRMGVLGDCTKEVVEWFLKYRPQEFIVRYGVYTDESGEMVKKKVRRIVELTVDNRDTDDDDIEWVRDGKKSRTKSPVARAYEEVTSDEGIIARRSTHLTFTPREVVGGFDTDDELATMEGGDES
jgi:hypothetical protein